MRLTAHLPAIASALAMCVCEARAAGVAVLKEQFYHRDSTARAVAFTRIIDSHGPYLRIVSGKMNVDIQRSKLAEFIELPDRIPPSIMVESDISSLRQILADMRKFISRYHRSGKLLESHASALAAHVARFDEGQIRFEGLWLSRDSLAGMLETRSRAAKAENLEEVEERVFAAAQRDKGLLMHDGRWMTRDQIENLAPGSPTRRSEAIEPLANADFDGAGFAVKNLTTLAAGQTGAAKVQTQRLLSSIRNLFLAESRVTNQQITSSADTYAAAIHDKNAAQWLKPNAFGTVYPEMAVESRLKAMKIRKKSADELARRRQELLDQLLDAGIVAADFRKLREERVVLILENAVRAVGSRHFTDAEFRLRD